MPTPFLGEIKMISWNYPPKGWAFCNGQLLPINQNQALFSILGTTYGGNGQTNFALPNLQGRVPVHVGNGINLGEQGGAQAVTLNISQIGHGHNVNASATANTNTAAGNYPAAAPSNTYGASADTSMNPGVVSSVGGTQPHNNMQPYLVINFVIALQGIFPTQN
jgi:microcystin-dependent protein